MQVYFTFCVNCKFENSKNFKFENLMFVDNKFSMNSTVTTVDMLMLMCFRNSFQIQINLNK